MAAASAATAGPLDDATARKLFAREQKLLEEMTEVAEASRGLPDARVRKLIDWIREKMCPDLPKSGRRPAAPAKWNNVRVIIFTEYDDTKRYLNQQLSAAIEGTDRVHLHLEHRVVRRLLGRFIAQGFVFHASIAGASSAAAGRCRSWPWMSRSTAGCRAS